MSLIRSRQSIILEVLKQFTEGPASALKGSDIAAFLEIPYDSNIRGIMTHLPLNEKYVHRQLVNHNHPAGGSKRAYTYWWNDKEVNEVFKQKQVAPSHFGVDNQTDVVRQKLISEWRNGRGAVYPAAAVPVNIEMPKQEQVSTNMSTDQAAAYLGLQASSLHSMRHKKRGPPYYKIGKRVFYDVKHLKEWRHSQLVHHDR